MNRTVKGVALVLLAVVGIGYAAVNGKFANIDASGYVHSATEMTAPFFHGLANTASALAATPSQCSGGTPLATGIAANGNANCTASPVPNRTCNVNGCYIIYPDGTIQAWGISAATSGGGSAARLAITFPITFGTVTSLVVSPTGEPNGDGNPHPQDCHVSSGPTTGGATATIALPTQISGSGYSSLAAGEVCSWQANGS